MIKGGIRVKKVVKIGCVVLGCLIIVSGMIMLWQWDNMRAVTQSVQYSQVELVHKIETTKVEDQMYLLNYGVTKVRDFTFEEEEAIRKGALSPTQVIAQLQEEVKEQIAPEEEESFSQEEQIQAIITKHMADVYGVKARFIGALGNLEKEARAEFAALPKEERNMLEAQKIVLSKAGQAANLESECNQEVSKILVSLELELTPLTDDLSIIEKIHSAYEEEKVLKKAYYLSLLNK